MDQGVIRSLKAKYRRRVIRRMIDAIDQGKPLPSISILGGMKILILPWEVSANTIINCFSKAGFSDANADLDDDPFRDLISMIEELCICDPSQVPTDIMMEDVVSINDQAIASQPYMNDHEIIADIFDEDIEVVNDDEPNKPTPREVCEAINVLLNFTLFTDEEGMRALAMKYSESIDAELKKATTQSCITYFCIFYHVPSPLLVRWWRTFIIYLFFLGQIFKFSTIR